MPVIFQRKNAVLPGSEEGLIVPRSMKSFRSSIEEIATIYPMIFCLRPL